MRRRSDNLPVLGLAGAGLALTLVTTGCEVTIGAGSPSPEAGGESPGSTAAAEASPTGSAGAGTPAAGATPDGGDAEAPGASGTCGAGDLRAAVKEDQDGFPNNVVAALELTNVSSAACVIPKGWVTLGVREGGGYRELRTMRENHPDAGADITLKPGGTAYAGMTWTADADCPALGEVGVQWGGRWIPAPGTWVEVIGEPKLCGEAMTFLGTFQPTVEDVLHW